MTLDAGDGGRFEVAISTCSKKNRDAGFDARMRVAVIASNWVALPAAGLLPCDHLDYGELETQSGCKFSIYERTALEELLVEKTSRAIFAEVWGALFVRNRIGIHEVHSRRASCSVAQDIIGRDGAIRFYFDENRAAEMLLFKYCGQS